MKFLFALLFLILISGSAFAADFIKGAPAWLNVDTPRENYGRIPAPPRAPNDPNDLLMNILTDHSIFSDASISPNSPVNKDDLVVAAAQSIEKWPLLPAILTSYNVKTTAKNQKPSVLSTFNPPVSQCQFVGSHADPSFAGICYNMTTFTNTNIVSGTNGKWSDNITISGQSGPGLALEATAWADEAGTFIAFINQGPSAVLYHYADPTKLDSAIKYTFPSEYGALAVGVSPDGCTVLCSIADKFKKAPAELWVMTIEDGAFKPVEKIILDVPFEHVSAEFSPNGKYFAIGHQNVTLYSVSGVGLEAGKCSSTSPKVTKEWYSYTVAQNYFWARDISLSNKHVAIGYTDLVKFEQTRIDVFEIEGNTSPKKPKWTYMGPQSNGVYQEVVTTIQLSADDSALLHCNWGDEKHTNPQIMLFNPNGDNKPTWSYTTPGSAFHCDMMVKDKETYVVSANKAGHANAGRLGGGLYVFKVPK